MLQLLAGMCAGHATATAALSMLLLQKLCLQFGCGCLDDMLCFLKQQHFVCRRHETVPAHTSSISVTLLIQMGSMMQ